MMGLPTGWTDIGISQTARKRCIGNAVVVPVAEVVGTLAAHLLDRALVSA